VSGSRVVEAHDMRPAISWPLPLELFVRSSNVLGYDQRREKIDLQIQPEPAQLVYIPRPA